MRLAEHPKVVAIGEAGLDYHYDNSPREAQATGFRRTSRRRATTGLPLVIHAREADDDIAAILRGGEREGRLSRRPPLLLVGPRAGRAGLALGDYVSFSGILTFKNAEELREIARDLPADRILVETDAPYLAPLPHRGKRNEPAYRRRTPRRCSPKRAASAARRSRRTTTENFFRLFSKVPRR